MYAYNSSLNRSTGSPDRLLFENGWGNSRITPTVCPAFALAIDVLPDGDPISEWGCPQYRNPDFASSFRAELICGPEGVIETGRWL